MQKPWTTVSKGICLHKPFLQHRATSSNKNRQIVAPKVAGSSLVGHPPVFRIGKVIPQNRDAV
jgi:hypothetical protein